MKVVEPGFEFIGRVDGMAIIKSIEIAGRTCYKSESNITDESAREFVASIIKRGHESVLEHEKVSVKIICDRGVSHEIVRHRIASYSQESTRYCNYSKDRFGGELTVIAPHFWEEDSDEYATWYAAMEAAERAYNSLVLSGAKPEEARTVLPNSLKTEIVVTMNLREWRHFFKLRAHSSAHPQIREIAIPLLMTMRCLIPVVFDDIADYIAD